MKVSSFQHDKTQWSSNLSAQIRWCVSGFCVVKLLFSASFFYFTLRKQAITWSPHYPMKQNITFYFFDRYNDLKFIHTKILFLFLHLCMQLMTEIIVNSWIVIQFVEPTERLGRQMVSLQILFQMTHFLSAGMLVSVVYYSLQLHLAG